jgi:flagellar protein FliJ
MHKFHGLQLAIDMAVQQRDARLTALGQAQGRLRIGQQQQDQLQSYANDTDSRWASGASVAISAELVRHHYQFVGRLQHAIGMQEGVIANLVRQQEASRAELAQAEAKVAGLRKVLASRLEAAEQVAQRREQAQMDEMAALAYARKRDTTQMEDYP